MITRLPSSYPPENGQRETKNSFPPEKSNGIDSAGVRGVLSRVLSKENGSDTPKSNTSSNGWHGNYATVDTPVIVEVAPDMPGIAVPILSPNDPCVRAWHADWKKNVDAWVDLQKQQVEKRHEIDAEQKSPSSEHQPSPTLRRLLKEDLELYHAAQEVQQKARAIAIKGFTEAWASLAKNALGKQKTPPTVFWGAGIAREGSDFAPEQGQRVTFNEFGLPQWPEWTRRTKEEWCSQIQQQFTPKVWVEMTQTERKALKVAGCWLKSIARRFDVDGDPVQDHTIHLALGRKIWGEGFGEPESAPEERAEITDNERTRMGEPEDLHFHLNPTADVCILVNGKGKNSLGRPNMSVVLGRRQDGTYALIGGFADRRTGVKKDVPAGEEFESLEDTSIREFNEEALAGCAVSDQAFQREFERAFQSRAKVDYFGPVHDPRNTEARQIVTTLRTFCISPAELTSLKRRWQASSDIEEVRVVPVAEALTSYNLYGSHRSLLSIAYEEECKRRAQPPLMDRVAKGLHGVMSSTWNRMSGKKQPEGKKELEFPTPVPVDAAEPVTLDYTDTIDSPKGRRDFASDWQRECNSAQSSKPSASPLRTVARKAFIWWEHWRLGTPVKPDSAYETEAFAERKRRLAAVITGRVMELAGRWVAPKNRLVVEERIAAALESIAESVHDRPDFDVQRELLLRLPAILEAAGLPTDVVSVLEKSKPVDEKSGQVDAQEISQSLLMSQLPPNTSDRVMRLQHSRKSSLSTAEKQALGVMGLVSDAACLYDQTMRAIGDGRRPEVADLCKDTLVAGTLATNALQEAMRDRTDAIRLAIPKLRIMLQEYFSFSEKDPVAKKALIRCQSLVSAVESAAPGKQGEVLRKLLSELDVAAQELAERHIVVVRLEGIHLFRHALAQYPAKVLQTSIEGNTCAEEAIMRLHSILTTLESTPEKKQRIVRQAMANQINDAITTLAKELPNTHDSVGNTGINAALQRFDEAQNVAKDRTKLLQGVLATLRAEAGRDPRSEATNMVTEFVKKRIDSLRKTLASGGEDLSHELAVSITMADVTFPPPPC